ncbi:unannotated protein [freshwater metagenome]|uniref:Unannotated protein n=1 Tax=freshwater metagenome TaxID=449393 RepID=A0A6J6GI29_9ZZZZ
MIAKSAASAIKSPVKANMSGAIEVAIIRIDAIRVPINPPKAKWRDLP